MKVRVPLPRAMQKTHTPDPIVSKEPRRSPVALDLEGLVSRAERFGHRVADLSPHEAPVQAAAMAPVAPSVAEIQQAAAHGTSGRASALPFAGVLQRAFGRHDLGAVRAFTDRSASEGARRMGAVAFTTPNGMAFDGPPDLHTAAHEAAHAIQQRGGVQLAGGVGRAGDAYERHADAVADLVVAGRSAESLLDRGLPAQPAPTGVAVQRKMGFEFETGRNLFTPAFARKQVVYETNQLTLEADGPGTHMEFVTKPFEPPDEIAAAVGAAAALAEQIADESAGGTKQVTRKKEGSWKEAVTMTIKDPAFYASPQHTEGVPLAGMGGIIDDYLPSQAVAIGTATDAAVGTAAVSGSVKGLLRAIVMYINRAQAGIEPSKDGPKATFMLMARSSFRSMFLSLEKDDRAAFTALVPAIPAAVGLALTDRVFKNPYFASDDGTTKNAGPTLGEWLASIAQGRKKYDAMSPPPGIKPHVGNAARNRYGMGAYGMDEDSSPKLALFEMRGHRGRNKNLKAFPHNKIGELPAATWTPWAKSIVDLAVARGYPYAEAPPEVSNSNDSSSSSSSSSSPSSPPQSAPVSSSGPPLSLGSSVSLASLLGPITPTTIPTPSSMGSLSPPSLPSSITTSAPSSSSSTTSSSRREKRPAPAHTPSTSLITSSSFSTSSTPSSSSTTVARHDPTLVKKPRSALPTSTPSSSSSSSSTSTHATPAVRSNFVTSTWADLYNVFDGDVVTRLYSATKPGGTYPGRGGNWKLISLNGRGGFVFAPTT